MSLRDTSLIEANAAAVAQRQRLRHRLDATRARLVPSRLKFDAEQKAEQVILGGAQKAVGQVKAHPILSGLGVAAIIAWAFREPLAQHGPTKLRTAYDWLTSHLPFSEEPLSNNSEPDPADDLPPPPPVSDGQRTDRE